MSILESFLDLIFPPRCLVCRKLNKEVFCKECFQQVKFLDNIESATVYDGVIKEGIGKLKFHGKQALAVPLGRILANHFDQRFKNTYDIITSVPLHKNRKKKRGFNQSDLLSRIVSEKTSIPFHNNVLERIIDTKPQFDLNRKERTVNIIGAFKVTNAARITGRKVLLIDDIITTGSTVKECAMVLKKAGAKEVSFLSLARATEI